ncbi:acyltransferase family protein [Mycobacterium genavense]|uniref:acyltransferase family protein n=1 Tax=Mycobacterium genavense TaxID=36812 RepID=UPI00047057C9|nr:acyltransferase [Mycobacterium genavense]
MKLGQAFDPRNNALNACRLVLASEVILWHSFPITGHAVSSKPVVQLLFSVGVDGFFALAGFLITASWLRNPHPREYLVARALRIFPGLIVCLVVTGFVFAPLGVAMQGGAATKLLMSSAPTDYVLKNSTLLSALALDVAGTPKGVPEHGVWNASAWTLMWEVLCYLAVAGIGLAGLANRRWLPPMILALAVIGSILLPPLTYPGPWTNLQIAVRFTIMFSAGATLYQWRDVIPARWPLVAVSVFVVLASSLLPDYRAVGGPALAYAVIVSGSLIHSKRLNLRTDLSYGTYIYASPVQQLMAVGGLTSLNPSLFFVVATAATMPLAALSWFLVERPAQALKSRFKQKHTEPSLTEHIESHNADLSPFRRVAKVGLRR